MTVKTLRGKDAQYGNIPPKRTCDRVITRLRRPSPQVLYGAVRRRRRWLEWPEGRLGVRSRGPNRDMRPMATSRAPAMPPVCDPSSARRPMAPLRTRRPAETFWRSHDRNCESALVDTSPGRAPAALAARGAAVIAARRLGKAESNYPVSDLGFTMPTLRALCTPVVVTGTS